MRILLTGATGFIGRALAQALAGHGHEVVRVGRTATGPHALQADFAAVPDRRWWQSRLGEMDAVVNAAGILRERGAQTFEAVHTRGPIELFAACAAARVPKVIQVSALGADERAHSRYHLSKKAADDALRALPLDAAFIVQPSLVYGPGGDSAALFNRLAAAPLLPFPLGGAMQVQPVHLDDVVEGIVRLLESPAPGGVRTLAFSGPQPMALADYLRQLRSALGWRSALRVLAVPAPLFRAAAGLAAHLPGSMLDRETAGMLLAGNAAPSDAFAQLLGRSPRPPAAFVPPAEAAALRTRAALDLWGPVLQLAIAAVWIWTGIASLGLYPVADSHALLARVGLQGEAATAVLYGAALLDIALGALTLAAPRRWRAAVWAAQLLLIGGYTVLITLFLPEYWLHPYGPLTKNLPMMAAIALLWALEPPRGERPPA